MKREKFNGFIDFAHSGRLIESVRVRAQIGPKNDLCFETLTFQYDEHAFEHQ